MEQKIQKASEIQSSLAKFKNLLNQDSIKQKFNEALGKKAPIFTSNLVTIMSGSSELQKCEHMSIVSSALMAASMDLPLTPGLGFAGIVPYWDSQSGMMKAQFQIMKKGYIQLAQRTGLLKTINVCEVYEGEIKRHNRFTGEYEFDEFSKSSDKVIGYVSYFKLVNGFEKYFYMPIEKLDKHAKQFSKSFQRGKGKWADREQGGYEQMCEKTVLKLNLSTYAPMTNDINMMNAIIYDQAEIRDLDAKDYDYIDNEASVKPSEKEVFELKENTTITVDKSHQERSQNLTSKAADKIDKINKPPQEDTKPPQDEKGQDKAEDQPEEKPPVIENNEEIKAYTKEELDKMETKDLLSIVEGDKEMNAAKDILEPVKNTGPKLKRIIELHQEGELSKAVGKFVHQKEVIKAKEETKAPDDSIPMEPIGKEDSEEVNDDMSQGNQGEGMQPNLGFEEEKKSLDQPPSEQLTSNSKGIEVSELLPGDPPKRDFGNVNKLWHELEKQFGIDSKTFETIVENQLPELKKYKIKEDFLKFATAHEVHLLINTVK